MKTKTILLILLLSSICLNSCAIYGLTSDYGKLTTKERALIKDLNSFENLENNKIYPVDAIQLKEEIKKYPKALVYVFTNGCNSEYCLPMASYLNFANDKDMKLFLVMTGYANIYHTLDQNAGTPYFSINHNYYQKNIRGVNYRYFINELMDLPRNDKIKDFQGDLFFFENGELKEIRRNLPDL